MSNVEDTLKNLIKNKTNFLIASEKEAGIDVFFAGEILGFILRASNKKVLDIPQRENDLLGGFDDVRKLKETGAIPEKIIISIPKNTAIEEIKYEDNNNLFSIIITPKKILKKEDIIISKKTLEIDAAFLFFSPENKKYLEELSSNLVLPPKKGMIFFTKNSHTLAQKIFNICEIINPSFFADNKTLATLIYGLLVLETDNFQKKTDEGVFKCAHQLLAKGVEKEKLRNILTKNKNIDFANTLGRALARTHFNAGSSVSWTFLSKKDMKTEQEGNKVFFVGLAEKIRTNLPYCNASFLIWEKNNGIAGLVYSQDEVFLKKASASAQVAQEDNYFFTKDFKNFTEAELKLRELLKIFEQDTME